MAFGRLCLDVLREGCPACVPVHPRSPESSVVGKMLPGEGWLMTNIDKHSFLLYILKEIFKEIIFLWEEWRIISQEVPTNLQML